jgi:hypothetical protein
MDENISLLPIEVKELAVKVSEQKQQEVISVLNQIFTGTSDWEKQVDAIEVKSIADKMSIQLANTARINVKNARLYAEKVFDAKRDEVQQIKSEYDLEDKLWLKAKQVMQIKFKAIEEKAEWKAKTIERYEAEQKELRTQIRIEKVAKFNPELNRIEFENMSNEMFDIFIPGIEKAHNDKIEAEKKAEAERLAAIEADRLERERIKAENERLQKEAAEKEKALAIERKAVEEKARIEREKQAAILAKERAEAAAKQKVIEAKAAAERAEAERKLKEQQEKAREEAEKAAAERAKLQAELQAKKDAEIAEQKAIEQAALAAKLEVEKAAKAPKKEKLTVWVDGFVVGVPAGMNNDTTVVEILAKFESFKSWAKKLIETI